VHPVVQCNTAEDALLRRLLDSNEHNLHSIPSQHHHGEPLQLEIKLALKKIIKMVRLQCDEVTFSAVNIYRLMFVVILKGM